MPGPTGSREEGYQWGHRHLLGLEELSAEDIRFVLQTARGLAGVSTRSVKKVPALRGRVVVNLFFEDSTRTKSSFFLAASRMSADVLDFTAKTSSVAKGETFRDTAKNIEAMGVDVIVVRHSQSGAAKLLAQSVSCSVVNAGDGQHEHPTQGLLDLYTLAERLGRAGDSSEKSKVKNETSDSTGESGGASGGKCGGRSGGGAFDLSGLTVGIVGDINHSRVARSNIYGLTKLGAKVVLIGPPTLVSGGFREMGCEVCHNLDEALPKLDAINMLRIQFERIGSQQFPGVREYAHLFGLNAARMAKAKPDLVVMHPGPINRGLEIESVVADGPNSVILQQVTNGLAVRMAVLFLVTGAG